MKNRVTCALAMLLILAILPIAGARAARPLSKGHINSEGNWVESIEQQDARMAWLKDAKFGMMIHWGLYSVAAGEYKGKPSRLSDWIQSNLNIPIKEYQKLGKDFTGVKFNAEEWVKLAEQAGMKYIVIIAKHYDGFSMYDTKVSDYDVVDATSFGKDPIKELAEACKKHGIKLGFSYSLTRDWHEPKAIGNYWDFPSITRKEDGTPDWDKIGISSYFKEKASPQLEELLTNYGDICLLLYLNQQHLNRQDAENFTRIVRQKQPDCIMDQLIFGEPADNYKIGDIDTSINVEITHTLTDPWISTSRINGSWGYSKNDNNWLSTGALISKLVDVTSKNGSFLLNVGPDANGVIPQPTTERLLQIGQWLKVNSESIYGTKPSPYRNLVWGRCTSRPGKLYLHVLTWPKEGKLELARLNNKVKKAYLLSDQTKLTFKQNEDNVLAIDIPKEPVDPYDTVIVLEIENAPDIEPASLQKVVRQDNNGFINCVAETATINVDGEAAKAKYYEKNNYIGYWGTSKCYITWSFMVKKAGDFKVELTYSCKNPNTNKCIVDVGGRKLVTNTPTTGTWNLYQTMDIGQVNIDQAGEYVLVLRYISQKKIESVNIKGIRLVPVPKSGSCSGIE